LVVLSFILHAILYILLAIVGLLVVALSISLSIHIDYEDVLKVRAKWFFLTINLFPPKKKEKAVEVKEEEKPPEEKEEKPPKKKKEKPPKPAKKNPLQVFYENEGIEGVLNILGRVADALGGMFGSVIRHFIIRELFVDLRISGGDAAHTAIKYGKVCEKAFPALGFICAKMKVGKYDMDIYPDFLANKDKAEYHLVFAFRPVFMVGAGIALVFKLIFKVLIKFLLSAKPKKEKDKEVIEATPA